MKKELSPRAIQVRMSITEIFYNFCIASSGFSTVLLQSLGLGAEHIGLVSSLTSIAGIAAPPVFGVISDKIRSVRNCFILCLSLAALCMVGVPFAAKTGAPLYLAMTALLVISALFTGPANNMMENWLIQIDLRYREISYGSMRIWASLGYAALGLIYVPLLKKMDVANVYILYFLFAIPAVLLALQVPSVGRIETNSKAKTPFRELPFKQIFCRGFVLYVLFMMLHNIPNNWKNTFFIYILNLCGYDSRIFGLFMFISACCEVPALLFSRKAVEKFGVVKPMIISFLLYVVEVLLYSFARSLAPIILAQMLKGAANGMLFACQLRYLYSIAPKGLETTAHALLGSLGSIVTILAAAAGGFLLEAIGTRPFFDIIAVLELIAVAFFILTLKFSKRPSEKESETGAA